MTSTDPGYLLNQIDQELTGKRLVLMGLDSTPDRSTWLLLVPDNNNVIIVESNSVEQFLKEDVLKLLSDILYQKIYDPWTFIRGEHSLDLWSFKIKRM